MDENTNEIGKETQCGVFTIEAKNVRFICEKLAKYYNFTYQAFSYEIEYAIQQAPNGEYNSIYFNTKKPYYEDIDYFPDDYPLTFVFLYSDVAKVDEFVDKYAIPKSDILYSLFLLFLLFLKRWYYEDKFYDPESDITEFDIINSEKRKLYEFLLDAPRDSKARYSDAPQMEIRYGNDSKIVVNNFDDWLYNLLTKDLNRHFTVGGMVEFKRNEKPPKRPSNAPTFGNYVAYNTYLLLKDMVGSESKYPAEFSKFIIDLCRVCEVKLMERQTEVIGMKEYLSYANRQYKGEPIPFSLVRSKFWSF